jgi:hypothetical protein
MRARHRHFSYKAAEASIALDARYINEVSDGTTVETWSDRSGNGRDATQTTSGNRATYKAAIQGGSGVLRFDGGDFYTATFTTGTAYSAYFILKRTGGGSNAFGGVNFIFAAGTSGSTNSNARRYQMTFDGNASGVFQVLSNATTGTNQTRNDNWNVHSVSSQIGSGNQSYYLNGGGEVSASVSSLAGVTSGTVRMTIGERSWDTGAASLRLNGDVGLIVTYETAHAAPLRKRCEHAAAFSFKISCN